MNIKRKRKGSVFLGGIAIIAILFFITQCYQTLASGQFRYLSAVKTAEQAKQYAVVVADTLKLQSLEDITDNIGASISLNNNETLALNNADDTTQHSLSELLGDSDKWTGWNYNISIEDGPANSTNNSDDATVQKIATVRIFKDGDTISRYSEQVPLSLQGSSKNGLEIGMIVPWPTADWQNDMKVAGGNPDNFLVCNGQVINSSKYPKLAKIMNHTPNYQGMFLRGLGGNSAAIGQIQNDAIRNITGTLDSGNTISQLQLFGETPNAQGAFANFDWFYGANGADQGNYYRANGLSFDASRVVPTANENRPINTAVIFLIKAK